MHTPQAAHLSPGDTAYAKTVHGTLRDFEVVRIGGFDIFTAEQTTPEELAGIAAAFRDAEQLLRERLMAKAAEPPGASE